MQETRQTILEFIKNHGSATVNTLTTAIGVTPVTVRHHLLALMGDGLVRREPVRSGVGRPQHRYLLTEAGLRQFPNRYHVLAAHLLTSIKSLETPLDIERLLETIVSQTLPLPDDLAALPPPERLHALVASFNAQQISAVVNTNDDGQAELRLSCPYAYIAKHHPELCRVDEKVLRGKLSLPMQRAACLLDGDKSCTFSIQLTGTESIQPEIESGSNA